MFEHILKRLKLIHIICAFLALPFGLNFILKLNCGFNVIGDNNAPVVWLQFWGTYLAAVAAFCVIFQNYKRQLQNEEKERNRRIENYMIHQVGNNIYLKFYAIFNEISKFKKSSKSVWKTDIEDSRILYYNSQLYCVECEIHFAQIELLSIPYNNANLLFQQYTKDLELLFKTTLEMINKTKQYLKEEQSELSVNDLENLKGLNNKLFESAKQVLNGINQLGKSL